MGENNELGRKLKSHRMAKEMSQKDFAAFIGIPFRTYQNYEAGHRYPKSMDVVNKMATSLGITTEDLIGSAGGYIADAGEKGNIRDQRRMEQIGYAKPEQNKKHKCPENSLRAYMGVHTLSFSSYINNSLCRNILVPVVLMFSFVRFYEDGMENSLREHSRHNLQTIPQENENPAR